MQIIVAIELKKRDCEGKTAENTALPVKTEMAFSYICEKKVKLVKRLKIVFFNITSFTETFS